MSIFTNRFDAATAEADAYTVAVLERLGDQDPLEVLAALPACLEEKVEGLSEQQLRQPEKPGKWSIIEIVQHLADSELVWAYRLRSVIALDGAPISGYDQDAWASALRYRDVALETALTQVREIRTANLTLLRSLTPDELQHNGVHSERGPESVEHMIRLYAGHDLVHLAQLDRVRSGLLGQG